MNFMPQAIEIAKKSGEDLPIGCIIVKEGKIIASSHNEKESVKNPTGHAEILSIIHACEKINSKYLQNCEMYVTLEPCPMCMWAILEARIEKLFFGAYDYKYGAAGSVINLKNLANSKIIIQGGIMESDCEKLLKNYFKGLRK